MNKNVKGAHVKLMRLSKKTSKKIKFKKPFNSNMLTAFAAVFVVIGLVTLLSTFAAPAPNGKSSEGEITTATLNTATIADATASGVSYLELKQTTVAPPPPPATTSPSGQAMPVGDLPGWKQIFTDDFTTNVPLGSFPTAVSDKWGGYPYPYRDTRGQRSTDKSVGGWYHPGKTISIVDGMMDIWVHTELVDGVKKRLVAAPEPKINGPNATGPNGVNGQLYGRYAVRFRLDPSRIENNAIGYKTAWLLWPKSNIWPRDGEIDFPEGNLNGKIYGFLHKQDATVGSDQYYAVTDAVYTDWNTAVIEWGPDKTSFLLNGKLITNASGGKSEWTERIPNTPMRYILQTETTLSGDITPEISEGHIQIDWIAVYSRM